MSIPYAVPTEAVPGWLPPNDAADNPVVDPTAADPKLAIA
jgi:hypothetical protein